MNKLPESGKHDTTCAYVCKTGIGCGIKHSCSVCGEPPEADHEYACSCHDNKCEHGPQGHKDANPCKGECGCSGCLSAYSDAIEYE